MQGQQHNNQNPPQNTQSKTLANELYQMGFTEPKVSQALSIYQSKQDVVNYLLNGDNKNNVEQEVMKNESDDFEDQQQDYKMIFVVRMDLKLALHKIAELTATAALRAYKQIESQIEVDQNKEMAFYQWTQGGQRKIVVKSPTDKQLLQLAQKAKAANINFVLVEQLPSNLKFQKAPPLSKKQKAQKKQAKEDKVQNKEDNTSEAKLEKIEAQPAVQKEILILGAFGPAAESEIDPLTKHFKLL